MPRRRILLIITKTSDITQEECLYNAVLLTITQHIKDIFSEKVRKEVEKASE